MKRGVGYIIFGIITTVVGILLTIVRAVPASSVDPSLIPPYSVIINDRVINMPTVIGSILGLVILVAGITFYINTNKKG